MLLRGLASAANGMTALIEQNDSIANNIANVNTVGFKQEKITFKNLYDEAIIQKKGNGANAEDLNIGNLSMGSVAEKLTYDFSQGALNSTSNPFDVAIEGDGFFKIKSQNGDISYTRNGSFTLNNNSNLVTKEGDFVLDEQGKPIVIDTNDLQMHSNRDIIITEDGQISINNEKNQVQLQKIGIYDFDNKEDMINIGGSHFRPTDPQNNRELKAEKYTIQQGALEMSNANIVREMINSINTSKNYEALSKLTKEQGSSLSRVIQLGRIRTI